MWSGKVWKDGLRYLKDGDTVQRWLCRECAYRFSDPSHKRDGRGNEGGSYSSSQDWNLPGLPLKVDGILTRVCQVGALSRKRARNLVEVETRQEEALREGTNGADVKGKLVEYLWWMKKEGYAESTIERRASLLKNMVKKGANLLNPESVKEVIAKQEDYLSYL